MSTHTPRHAAPRTARRGLAATGVLSIALAGGAFTFAGAGSASAATGTANYNCKLTNAGFERTFTDPWTVTMTADVPASVAPGAAVPAPAITAKVTTGKDAADQLRGLNVKTIEGTAAASYSVASTMSTANLTIPKVNVPTSGGIVTNASGTGAAFTAPTTPGTVKVAAGSFTTDQTTDSGFVLHISCSPAAGANTSLGSITVGSPSTSSSSTPTTSKPSSTSSSPTSTTSKPSSTSSTSTSSKPSTSAPTSSTAKPTTPAPSSTSSKPSSTSTANSTAAPTSSTASATSSASSTAAPSSSSSSSTAVMPTGGPTTTPSAPSKPATGPKVDTDLLSQKDGLNVLGVGFAAAGVVALGGAALLGRRRSA